MHESHDPPSAVDGIIVQNKVPFCNQTVCTCGGGQFDKRLQSQLCSVKTVHQYI